MRGRCPPLPVPPSFTLLQSTFFTIHFTFCTVRIHIAFYCHAIHIFYNAFYILHCTYTHCILRSYNPPFLQCTLHILHCKYTHIAYILHCTAIHYNAIHWKLVVWWGGRRGTKLCFMIVQSCIELSCVLQCKSFTVDKEIVCCAKLCNLLLCKHCVLVHSALQCSKVVQSWL